MSHVENVLIRIHTDMRCFVHREIEPSSRRFLAHLEHLRGASNGQENLLQNNALDQTGRSCHVPCDAARAAPILVPQLSVDVILPR